MSLLKSCVCHKAKKYFTCLIQGRSYMIGQLKDKIQSMSKADFDQFEKGIIYLQRAFRAKKRQNTEAHRIVERYSEYLNKAITLENAKAIIQENSQPYRPKKCSAALADRIVSCAASIRFFDAIKHVTKRGALTSIFNDALYGNSTLQELKIPFTGAALCGADVTNGDGNAICFGASYGLIDPCAKGEVEFTYRFDRSSFTGQHCAFFKQLDFGFTGISGNKVWGTIPLCEDKLLHVGYAHSYARGVTLKVFYPYHSEQGSNNYIFSTLNTFELISYNIPQIEMVLILNFFKFIDNSRPPKDTHSEINIVDEIYRAIENMSNDELLTFLENVGKSISKIMEFNFYGAHKLDFSKLIEIKDTHFDCQECFKIFMRQMLNNPNGCLGDIFRPGMCNIDKSINLQAFIGKLNNGELDSLEQALILFPQIFKSCRFLDFLSENCVHPEALERLAALRNQSDVPYWYPSSSYSLHADRVKRGVPEISNNQPSTSASMSSGKRRRF